MINHTTGRTEYPNTEKAEENDFKFNFMKVIQIIKEETKNSFKVMEEKTKNQKKSINLLKPRTPTKNYQTSEANNSTLKN